MADYIRQIDPLEHLFLPLELAILTKEKGCNKECLASFLLRNDGSVSRFVMSSEHLDCGYTDLYSLLPTLLYQQLIDWYFEEHGWTIEYRPYNRSKMDYEIKALLERLAVKK